MRGFAIIAALAVPAIAFASAPQSAPDRQVVREAVPALITPATPNGAPNGAPVLRPAISVTPAASPTVIMVTTTSCEAGACLSVSRKTAASSRLLRAPAD